MTSLFQNRNARANLIAPQLSGEIFKEPFLDIFLTDSEQTAFSLVVHSEKQMAELKAKRFQHVNKKESPSLKSREKVVQANHTASPIPRFPFSKSVLTAQNQNHTQASVRKKITNQRQISQGIQLYVQVGDFVYSGDKIGESFGAPLVVKSSGRIIRVSNSQLVLQKTQPVLYYSQAFVHVQKGEWVEQNAPILTLTHQTLVTGDIVQGIPRIEQLFEAPHSQPLGIKEQGHLHETLHSQAKEIFRHFWLKLPLPAAVRMSLQQIQQILVESIQKVYLSQTVLIADKHIEIIVRQMTCKAQVLDNGDTGLLLEELLPVSHIENANLNTPGKKALYAPAVVGLTRFALESDSFISAASFQETTRVLGRDATSGKSDFLRGLKEKVVIGDLISAGTGLEAYSVYTLL